MTALETPARSHRAEPATPSRRRWLLGNALIALVAAVLLTRALVTEPLRVSSSSMAPTLQPGEHILVDKVSSRAHHPHRDDIIVFRAPGSGELLIKRVAAVAGDTVGIEDGVLVVNQAPVHEPYVNAAEMDSVYFGPVDVAPGRVFVLGDDRAHSVDSRSFGTVHVSAVTGRVLLRLWPPGNVR